MEGAALPGCPVMSLCARTPRTHAAHCGHYPCLCWDLDAGPAPLRRPPPPGRPPLELSCFGLSLHVLGQRGQEEQGDDVPGRTREPMPATCLTGGGVNLGYQARRCLLAVSTLKLLFFPF